MYPEAMRRLPRLALAFALLFAAAAWARQDPAAVKTEVEDYLRVQTQGLPGDVSYTIGALAPNNGLRPCAAFVVGRAPGARIWGRTNVTVRCAQGGSWSVFIPVQIRIVADYLVAGRPLAPGQVLTEADLATQRGDLGDLPTGVLTDAQQAVGRSSAMSVPAGKPLRADMLRQALVVRQGQGVKVVSRGPGFEVANDGRALNSAADGQVAQVRLGNGQVVSGIARAGGIVEVGF